MEIKLEFDEVIDKNKLHSALCSHMRRWHDIGNLTTKMHSEVDSMMETIQHNHYSIIKTVSLKTEV